MSEIDELAKELGIDPDTPDAQESTDVTVDTSNQLKNSEELVSKCVEIYKVGRENDLIWRWMIGEQVDKAYENETKYEKGVLKRLSEELDIAISDLSRFRKFYVSFDKEILISRACVGYTWSHFKMINDLPDGQMKQRMISMVEQEDEAPKTKDLQETISKEKNQQFQELDKEDGGSSTTSDSKSSSSSKSNIKPINSALIVIEKLGDYLSDIFMQEESGMDFDTDAKEEKYNESKESLKVRLDEIIEIKNKIWKD